MMTDTQLQTRVLATLYLLSAVFMLLLAIQNYRYGLFELVYSATGLMILFIGVGAYAQFAVEAKYLQKACFWSLVLALTVIIVEGFAYPEEVKHWLYPISLLSYIALSHRQATLLNSVAASIIGLIILAQFGLRSALAFAMIYTLLISLASTYAKLHQQRSRSLVELEIRDPLTRSYNYRHLEDTLGKEICRADRTGKPLSLISLEIDYLPQLLDLHEVATTNALVFQFAETLRAMIRAGDSEYSDQHRTFYLLLPCTPSEGVLVIAERIRRTIEASHWPVVDAITVSLGCTSYQSGKRECTVNSLINDANVALVEAQKNGHNRVCLHG